HSPSRAAPPDRHTPVQARDTAEAEPARKLRGGIQLPRHPHLRFATREAEACRHHPDDLGRSPEHQQPLTNHTLRGTEPRTPHAFADDRDAWTLRRVLFGGERATEKGRYFEQRNHLARCVRAHDAFRLA